MDVNASTLAAAIGERIRNERHARDWTLERLAEVAGVSRRMVINVEQGGANPSVGILLKISDALGIGLPALVEPPHPSLTKVVRRGDGATLWTGDHGGRGTLVAGTEPPDVVELWDWSLAPGDNYESSAHSFGTRELLHVLRGAITVEVAGESITLRAGDATSFAGSVAHAYRNNGATAARFSLAVFQPRVGVGARLEDRDA